MIEVAFPASIAPIYSLASPPSITPTLGAELLTDPGLEAWTSPTNLTNWSESIAGTSTVNQETVTIHGGANAARLDIDASNSGANINQTPALAVGNWYRLAGYIRASAAAKSGYLRTDLAKTWLNIISSPGTSWTALAGTGRVLIADPSIVASRNVAVSASIYFDDISYKSMVLATLLGSVQTGAVNISIAVALTIPEYLQGGCVLALDSATSPANFILVHFNRADSRVYVEECVAGVYTTLASTVTAYVAGAVLRAEKVGTTLTVRYNGAIVGVPVAVTEAGNTLCGLFATDASVAFANLLIESHFGTLRTIRSQNFVLEVALTLPALAQAGFVFCLDHPRNPQNFVNAYLDRTSNLVVVDQCIDGIRTNLLSSAPVSALTLAEKVFRIEKVGNVLSVSWNGHLAGMATMVDLTLGHSLAGLFGTDPNIVFKQYRIHCPTADCGCGPKCL